MIDHAKALAFWLEHPDKFGHLLGFEKLTTSHAEWIKIMLRAGKFDVLQAHRGSYKTTCGIVALVLRYLMYPETRVLIARKTITLASEVVKVMQKLFTTNGALRVYLYARWRITDAQTSIWAADKTNFAFKRSVTVQPSLTAAGVGGALTGAHFDFVWLDDIVTIEDRFSAAARRDTKSFFFEVENLVDPGGVTFLTSTPWHEDDVHAVIPPEVFTGRKFPFGTVELSPAVIADIEERRKKLPTVEWCANYELRHVQDRDTLGVFPQVETFDCDYCVGFIDPSFSDKTDTDSTAVAVVGVSRFGDLIFTGRNFPRSIADASTRREILDFLEQFTPVETVFESQLSDSSVMFLDALRADERGPVRNHWTVKRQTRNKHERISATIAAQRDRLKILAGTQTEFAHEVFRYHKNAEHDDAPDALAGAIETLATSPIIAEYSAALGIVSELTARK